MYRKVLIVDDIKLNRKFLNKILSNDFEVLEAENGEEAYAVLMSKHKMISAVILDILMPVVDGYQLLEKMRSNPELAQLPVIVTTGSTEEGSEIKALTLGANDYITKPYDPVIILHRIKNTIKLRETSSIINAMYRDELTGLYSRAGFFAVAQDMIRRQPKGYYIMACFDIDNFKIINDQYGNDKGDEVLRLVAEIFQAGFEPMGGICCRIMADNFAVLYPSSMKDKTEEIRKKAAGLNGIIHPISFSIGRYIVNDSSLSISAMYDRACLAKDSIKGRYDVDVAVYDESMRTTLLREQEIISEMDRALENKNFEVWFQPQYNHSTGALIGSEALVRWRHPQKGLISPAEFIPMFERNGFIYELDKYVWETVCTYLQKWRNEGLSPLPVSVNISRYDVLHDDLVDVIKALVEQYNIPVDLLRLEITESAFSSTSNCVIDVVKQLVDYGFVVEIDDFGCGYSSLNTLKDVPAQILKLDMRFLESNQNSQRGGNILESIVRMAKWIEMAVIAEGVETKEQADFLRSIGCNYIQGYYYARPMPVDEYEVLFKNASKEEKLIVLETVENLDNNSFWDPQSIDTLIFNSYVGGACIFEYHDGHLELIRASGKFIQMLGGVGMSIEKALNLSWNDYFDEENTQAFQNALKQSIETGQEISGEYMLLNLPDCPEKTYLHTSLRVIGVVGDRCLIYCLSENITAQRLAEQYAQNMSKQLNAIMQNINGGVAAITADENGNMSDILYASNYYYAMFGYNQEQFEGEKINYFSMIHPEDKDRIIRQMNTATQFGQTFTCIYRAYHKEGRMMWIENNISTAKILGRIQFKFLFPMILQHKGKQSK